MTAMHLVRPRRAGHAYGLRLTELHGKPYVSLHRRLDITESWRARIDDLLACHLRAEPVPRRLESWLRALRGDAAGQRTLARLTELGLIDRQQAQRTVPIDDHLRAYERTVAARRGNTAEHAERMARHARRVVEAVAASGGDDLRASDVLAAVEGWPIRDGTRRMYLLAAKDFAEWMRRDGRAYRNPLADLELPSPSADPAFQRRPLTIDELRRLLAYLATGPDRRRWHPADRRLVYWLAATTALRQDECRTLMRADLHLTERPATLTVQAANAKNRKAADVPIPAELAAELAGYVSDLHPGQRVFATMPAKSNRRHLADIVRVDYAAVGIPWQDAAGRRCDFHSLRCTAITEWFVTYGRTVREVAELARCSPRIAERYARGFRLTDYGWMDRGPRLGGEQETRDAVG